MYYRDSHCFLTLNYYSNLGSIWCSNDTPYGRPVSYTDSEAIKGPNRIAFAGTRVSTLYTWSIMALTFTLSII